MARRPGRCSSVGVWPGGGPSLLANTAGGADLIITWALFLNLLLLVVKLVPGLPLDGGHALVGVVWKLSGDHRRGGRVAAAIGLLTGLLLALFAIVAMAVLPGVWGSALPLLLMPIGAVGLWQIWMCWGGMLWLSHHGQLRIRDALVTAPRTADASTTAEAAWRQLFARHPNLLWVPVLGPVGHYMGMAHRGVVETAARSSPRRELAELAQLPEDDPLTNIVSPDTSLQDAMENSAIIRGGVLIVLDRFGRFRGVARRDEIKRRFSAELAAGRDPRSSHPPGS